ncbi:MAG: S1 RNA-binding domain-containing protein, partial [Phycisphaerae bacterium]
TDMSWGRINHPSELVKIDAEVEVKVLAIDKDKEKIALGLKQMDASPWEDIETKYPIGSVHQAEVVNIMSYGAFCKLEDGVEGLVHISEMSWTKRINHPSELVAAEQKVEVKVLDINKDKQEISLGMKQVEENPWDRVAEKYPPGSVVEGKVRNIANYGAFVEIEAGIDGLLHVSDLSWTKKVGHPSELLKKGENVQAVVLSVDQEKQRIALGLKQMQEDPWLHVIPENYRPGMVVQGHVTKIANFGVFVELEEGLEGLLHVSEIADEKIEKPESVLSAGQKLEVKILRVDGDERKIGLSLKRAQWAAEEETREKTRSERQTRKGLKGGLE